MSNVDDEREKLGEALYLKLRSFQPELAGKITGMMLDSLEDKQILAVLDDEPVLREKVDEALQVLNGATKTEKTQEQKRPKQDNKDNSKYKEQVKALEGEMAEAEAWAEDMQREWDEKETKWQKEKAALKDAVAAAEEKAKHYAESSTKSAEDAKIAAEKIDELSALVQESEKRLQGVAAEKAEVDEAAEQLKETATNLQIALAAEHKSAEVAQAAAAETEEKSTAAKSASSDKVAKLEKDLVAMDDELKKANKVVEELQKASDAAEEEVTPEKVPAEDAEALKSKLAEVEALVVAEKARCKDAERRAKEAAAEAEVEEKKAEKRAKDELRCREMEKDLENAQNEIKSYKAALKAAQASPDAKASAVHASPDAKASMPVKMKNDAKAKPVPAKDTKGAGKRLDVAGSNAPKVPEATAAEEPAKVAEAPPKVAEAVEAAPEEEEEEEEFEEESPVPEPAVVEKKPAKAAACTPKNKAPPTSGGKAAKKKSAGAVAKSSASSAQTNTHKSSLAISGTEVVAGCLALVVMIQLGLFVYEGWFGD